MQPKYTIHPQKNRRIGAAHTVKRIFFDLIGHTLTGDAPLQPTQVRVLRSSPVDTLYDEDTEWSASFLTVNDTNVTLSVMSVGDIHTFTVGWTGTLARARGGTGLGVAGASGNVLTSDGANWTSAAPAAPAHTQLSHSDSVYTAPSRGSLIRGNATPAWEELVAGAVGDILTMDAFGDAVWTAPTGGALHDLLSATHSDTLTAAVVRGDIIVGNSTPKWGRLAVGTAGKIFRSDGIDGAWSTIGLANEVIFNSAGILSGSAGLRFFPGANNLIIGDGVTTGNILTILDDAAFVTDIKPPNSLAVNIEVILPAVNLAFPVTQADAVNRWVRASGAGQQYYDDINFTDVTGGIAVSQMNGGTGASSSTFWRGDGTWHNAYHTVHDRNTPVDLTQRNILGFAGAGVSILDVVVGTPMTVVTIPGFEEKAEDSNTPITDTASTAVGVTTLRLFTFITLPTTEPFYIITGIEWKNGTTVAGATLCGVDLVNANPPTSAQAVSLAVGMYMNNTGASSIQRNSLISSRPIRGGTIIAVWIQADTTTHHFRTLAGAAANSRKTIAFPAGGAVPQQEGTAWTSHATRPYCKVYYRGYE